MPGRSRDGRGDGRGTHTEGGPRRGTVQWTRRSRRPFFPPGKSPWRGRRNICAGEAFRCAPRSGRSPFSSGDGGRVGRNTGPGRVAGGEGGEGGGGGAPGGDP